MSDTRTTPNMGLVLPIPSARPGPTYASDIDSAFDGVDGHGHIPGISGVAITPAALDINADLSFQANNLTNARSVRFTQQPVVLTGSGDVGCVYDVLGDLYWNSGGGSNVQITLGGSLNTGAIVTNVWAQRTITANLTILGSDTYTNINVNSSGALAINLPAANAVAAGRYYVISDVAGNTQTFNLSLNRNGSDTINGGGSLTLASNFGTWIVRSDGTSAWQLTYMGFAGLTAAALTYGSNSLDGTQLTIGSNTLDSSALTIGSSSITGTTVVVGSSSMTSATITAGTNFVAGSSSMDSSTITAGTSLVAGTSSLDTSTLTVGGGSTLTATTLTTTDVVASDVSTGTLETSGLYTASAGIDSNDVSTGTLEVSSTSHFTGTLTAGTIDATLINITDADSNALITGQVSKTLTNTFTTSGTVNLVASNLSFAIGANEKWTVEVTAYCLSTLTGGIYVGLNGPTGATASGYIQGDAHTNVYVEITTQNAALGTAYGPFATSGGAYVPINIRFLVNNGSSAGTVAFGIVTAGGGGTVSAGLGSYMRAHRTTMV